MIILLYFLTHLSENYAIFRKIVVELLLLHIYTTGADSTSIQRRTWWAAHAMLQRQ